MFVYGRGMSSTTLGRRQGIAILLLAGFALMAFVLVNLFRLAPIVNLSPATQRAAPAVAVPADTAPPPAAPITPITPITTTAPDSGSDPNTSTRPGGAAPNYLQDVGDGSTSPLPAADCMKGKCRTD